MRTQIYTNQNMQLKVDAFMGEYTVFMLLTHNGDEQDEYIVAWLPSFNLENNTVTWAQGHYGYTKEQAYNYLIEKEMGR